MDINVALLSFGMSGTVFHGPFISCTYGLRLYGVWERSKKTAAETYPGIKSYDSLEELLGDPEVQLVVVNTPTATHFDYALKSLQAGKHILVEKSFTTTAAEAEELISLADEKQLKIAVYQNRRFDSDFKTVKQVLNEGVLGDIREAEIHYDRFKEELSPKAHKETPGPGSGVLLDLGPHIIDQALTLFGMPKRIFADISVMRSGSRVDDYFEIVMDYGNLRARLHSTYIAREVPYSYIVHGRKGSFLKSRSDRQEADLQAGLKPGDGNWGKDDEKDFGLLHTDEGLKTYPSLTGDYREYFQKLSDYLHDKGPAPVPASEALMTMKIIDAARISSSKGCWIEP